MSNNTLISVGVGIVAGALVIATGGAATFALFAFSVGASVASMLLGPETPKNGATRPDEIQINQSAEDAVISVVFGTTRLAANYIYVGFDKVTAKPIKKTTGSGKSKTTQQVGYRYTVPISYGICMGPIDRLNRVMGSPGQDTMAKFALPGLGFTGGLPETFDIEFVKKDGDAEQYEGGSAKFYPGSSNQGTATTTDKNHRSVCWVDFASYRIDGSSSPRSLLFEIHRLPKALDSAGATVSGLWTRASNNGSDPEYYDANPAAVAWECLQDKTWGKGMNPDQLDQASFIKASNYYMANRIGYSSALGQTTLTELMARLRDIFGLWIWWDGQVMRARSIYDLSEAYGIRPIIQADDVVGSPTFSRASLSGTSNEVRLTFTNRNNNYQQEVATAMDLAHAETIGGIRSQSIDGSEIGSRRAAELLAHALLRQIAYPAATCQLKVRRTYSGLQPGSFVQLRWDEWRDGVIAETFWRVVDIEDDDQGSEGITLTLMEDIYATARFSPDDEWTDPSGTIENDDPLDDADLVLADLSDRTPGTITPIILWEPNSYISAGTRLIAPLATRQNVYVQSCSVGFQHLGSGITTQMGTTTALPINGTLLDAIPATIPRMSREAANEFRVQLYWSDQADDFADATGLVQASADHFATLANSGTCILLVNGEIFRIGFAEVTAPGVVTVRTFMRGEGGTSIATHTIGSQASFFDEFSETEFLPGTDIPTGSPVNLFLTPTMTGNDADATATGAPAGLGGFTFTGASIRPFSPEPFEATRVGLTWTVKIRPRVWGQGAGTKTSPQDDIYSQITSLTGMSLQFQKSPTSGPTVTVPAGTSYATPPFVMPAGISVDSLQWIPDTGDAGTGLIIAVITFDANPTALDIWAVINGMASTAPTTIPQP